MMIYGSREVSSVPGLCGVVVVGVGQAGLAAGYHLRRAGLEYVKPRRPVAAGWRVAAWPGDRCGCSRR
ncbi:hypothetical protein, partial [Micromonospora craterilacus]|uniref:hypothetical protein n=1 Tax=Micromonospora craterilacus TaxID=1655439 RepID=UPI001F1BDAEC